MTLGTEKAKVAKDQGYKEDSGGAERDAAPGKTPQQRTGGENDEEDEHLVRNESGHGLVKLL